MKSSKVCVLRVDDKGKQFKGYMADITKETLSELDVDKNNLEFIGISDALYVISNKDSAVMGYKLNRAVYDEGYNLKTILGGNIIVAKYISGKLTDINMEDMAVIEDKLRAIVAISHGFVFTKNYSELPEWENKND